MVFTTLKRFLLFNGIRPFVDKGKYDFKEHITIAVFTWSAFALLSEWGVLCWMRGAMQSRTGAQRSRAEFRR